MRSNKNYYFIKKDITNKKLIELKKKKNFKNFLYTKIHNTFFINVENKYLSNKYLSQEIILYGSGKHLNSVLEIVHSGHFKLKGLVTDKKKNKKGFIKYSDLIKKINKKKVKIIVAVGDNSMREKIFQFLKRKKFKFSILTHPTAVISNSAKISSGCTIHANSIINSNVVIGENTIVNNDVLVEHDCKIGKNCHIGPSVKIAGSTIIEDGTFIGIGTIIKNNIIVGKKVIVGAGSTITKNLKSNTVYIKNSQILK